MTGRKFEHFSNKCPFVPFILGLWIVCAVQAPLTASSQADAGLDTTGMRIGDPLTLILTVRTDPGETIRFPDLEASLEKFELLSSLPPQKYDEEGGASLERRSFKITTFETGTQAIPELAFGVMHADGSVDTLYTPQIEVYVEPLLKDTTAAADVRPLKGLIGVPRFWHTLAAWAALALVIIVFLAFAARKYLERRRTRLIEKYKPVKPSKPPYLIALEELDRIKAMNLIEKGKLKLFHVLISDTVRRCLEGSYAVDAMEMTTWELLWAMKEKNISQELCQPISDFLQACDLVKFAKYKPQIVEINATFNKAYDIVNKCRPVPAFPETGQQNGQRMSEIETAGGKGNDVLTPISGGEDKE